MNIVQHAWLPFRLSDGSEQVLPLASISNPNVVDFALPRADFQGAAYQFAIGLLQTVFAPQDDDEWVERYQEIPDEEELQAAFDEVAHAFNTVGDGPLFMQDFDILKDGLLKNISSLLIEAPGESTNTKNKDHFIKRDLCDAMSIEMAVLALFTLQINAPEGGRGNLTGLRGGGPLTTLVLPQSDTANLWQKLWLNVMHRDHWDYPDPDLADGSVFPWLVPTKEGKKGNEIYHTDVHPLHMFWAMPRRIRLLIDEVSSECKISGSKAELTVVSYISRPYGGNYSGSWDHPLTPYKWNPKKIDEDKYSVKAQQGGINYKTWDVLTLSSDKEGQRCASVIDHYQSISREAELSEQPRLWAFGYDMDSMKARGWYSVTMPLFHVEVDTHDEIVNAVKHLQSLANNALWHTRSQIKAAWFDKPGESKGDTSFIDLAFWQRSEAAFFTAVEHVTQQAKSDDLLTPHQASNWLNKLRSICTDLFDEYALSELGEHRAMAKRIKARQALMGWLHGGKDMKLFVKDYKIASIKDVA